MYDGKATAGSLGEQDVVCEKPVTIQPAVAFKHMGLLDGLVVFGQWFCPAKPHNTEDARILDEAAEDPHIICLLPNTVPIAMSCTVAGCRLAPMGRGKEITCPQAGRGGSWEHGLGEVLQMTGAHVRRLHCP